MKIILSILCITSYLFVCGQYPLLTSTNQQNNIFSNSAFSGTQDYLYANFLHRQQWQSFSDAPQLNFIAIGGPLKNEKIGMALHYKNASTGVFSANQFQADMNYNLSVGKIKSKAYKISFGLGVGIQGETIGFNKSTTTQPNDPSFSYQIKSKSTVFFASSVYFKSKNQEGGISLPDLLENKTLQLFYQRMLLRSGKLDLQASFFYRKLADQYQTIDLQSQARYAEKIILGAGYRTNKTLVFQLGLKVFSKLNALFSYDMAISKNTSVPMNATEFSLQYEFGHKIESTNTKVFQ